MIAAIEGDEANISLSKPRPARRRARGQLRRDRSPARCTRQPPHRKRRLARRRGRQPGGPAWHRAGDARGRIWLWSLGEGERYPSEAGSGGWHEMLLVIEGLLVIEAADGRHQIAAGDFLIFSSERPMCLPMAAEGAVRFVRNVVL